MVEITRRTALRAGAAGVAGAVLPLPGAAPAAGRTAARDAAPGGPGDLERRALAMDSPVFLLETAVPPAFGDGVLAGVVRGVGAVAEVFTDHPDPMRSVMIGWHDEGRAASLPVPALSDARPA
ncbi:hypothetical protein GCM10027187_36070 [Streptosporangium sandarakinum]|uniref:Uncharacterized protein n=1 Tax=Streptosporangium sandarakinum TaxID=1260955 RepID=A0A852VCE4_9ACTN|nr:hypothetical protein [Streptosporangium sandarakinum]NYF43835.1 hypothetical protein [Streptosporangium sandarakinum]